MGEAKPAITLALGRGQAQRRNYKLHDNSIGIEKEIITGFNNGGLQAGTAKEVSDGTKVIPKQENTYRYSKCQICSFKSYQAYTTPFHRLGTRKFSPSFLPQETDTVVASSIEKFEVAAQDAIEAQQDVSYGLQLRTMPSYIENGIDKDAYQLRQDLAQLPPEASLHDYETMPVESFGQALLRGMGWEEGKAIGRKDREEIQAKELLRRPSRLGLGAAPTVEKVERKYIKPGESRDAKDRIHVDQEGRVVSSKRVGETLKHRPQIGVQTGKLMKVIAGRHSGFKCHIIELIEGGSDDEKRARVRLMPSDETVTVRCSELGEINKSGVKRKERTEETAHLCEKGMRGIEKAWLLPHIRVKIIDKKVQGGKLYLKKGVISDVKSPTLCDVVLDDTHSCVSDLKQSQLETVVPKKERAPLLIVGGAYKGQKGTLLSRNIDTGLAAVQLASDFSIHKLYLDDIAEFTGSLDE